jgi:hypothetical protein
MGFSLKRMFRHPFGKHSVFHTVTKVGAKVAPFAAALIPGIGPLAGAGIAAGLRAGQGLSEGKLRARDLLGSAAAGAAGGLANKALLGGRGFRGFGGLKKGIAGAFHRGGPGDLGRAPEEGEAGGGFLGRAARSAGGFIRRNPLDAARIGLGAINTISAGRAAGRANAALEGGVGGVNRFLAAPPQISLPSAPYNPYAGGGPSAALARARRALAA